MEFVFRGKYALRIEESEVEDLSQKLDAILSVYATAKIEIMPEHICGDKNIHDDLIDDMFMDSWILTVYPSYGQTMLFVKSAGGINVTVRAINTETGNYDTFDMDVVDTLDVLEELSYFIRRSNSPTPPVENGFDSC
jgi:hypothetical protein